MITDKNAVVASYEDSGTKRNEQIIIAPNSDLVKSAFQKT